MFFIKVSFFIAFVLLLTTFLQEFVFKRVVLGRSTGHFLNKFSNTKIVTLLSPKPDTKEFDKLHSSLRDAGLKISVANYIFLWLLSMGLASGFSLLLIINGLFFKVNQETLDRLYVHINLDGVEGSAGFGLFAFFFILGASIPKAYLFLKTRVQHRKGEKEIVMLQTFTIMMLQIGSSVKYTVDMLAGRADVFKPILSECSREFSTNPEKSLDKLCDNQHKRVRKIGLALKKALANKNVSVLYLTNSRGYEMELAKLEKQSKLKKKEMFSLITVLIPLITGGIVVLYPWIMFSLNALRFNW